MAATPESIVQIPDDLLIEVLARVGSSSSEDLDSTKCCCRELRRIGEEPEVYRLARMTDNHIVAMLEKNRQWSESEERFVTKCVKSGNPFNAYAHALYNLVEKNDVEASLLHLDEATGTDAVTDPATYLKCVALLSSSSSNHKSAGLELLNKLKSSGKLEECRRRFSLLLIEMRWRGFGGTIDCRRTAPLCPNRPEELGGCALCDPERWLKSIRAHPLLQLLRGL